MNSEPVQPKFQMRFKDGLCVVCLVQLNGRTVPVGEQIVVYTHKNAAKAQLISDELNKGLFRSISIAMAVTSSRQQSGTRKP